MSEKRLLDKLRYVLLTVKMDNEDIEVKLKNYLHKVERTIKMCDNFIKKIDGVLSNG